VTILVDEARWPWRGDLWAHLVSDRTAAELHEFAAALGMRRLAFQGDHYDVDRVARRRALALGAEAVPSRELVRRLRAAGLRRRGTKPPRWQTVVEASVPSGTVRDEVVQVLEGLLGRVPGPVPDLGDADADLGAPRRAPGVPDATRAAAPDWRRAVAVTAASWVEAVPRGQLDAAVLVRPAAGAMILRGHAVASTGSPAPGSVVHHRSGAGASAAIELLWGERGSTWE
jgi:hypothetical protein